MIAAATIAINKTIKIIGRKLNDVFFELFVVVLLLLVFSRALVVVLTAFVTMLLVEVVSSALVSSLSLDCI